MKKEIWIEIICCLLAILFVYAALSKLLAYEVFKFQLGRSPFLTGMSDIVAWALPTTELCVSFLLGWKRTRLAGLYCSLFLMLLFTGYIYAMLHFSYYIPCSCGGVLAIMSWKEHLLFNIAFTLLSMSGIILRTEPTRGDIQFIGTH
jgi:hypothetical protein